MAHDPRPKTFQVRGPVLALGVAMTATSAVVAGVVLLSMSGAAAADVPASTTGTTATSGSSPAATSGSTAAGTPAPGSLPASPSFLITSPPATPPTATTHTWHFDGAGADGWFAWAGSGEQPWLAPAREAAFAGGGGLQVGDAGHGGSQVYVTAGAVVAPGAYRVTGKLRMAPGEAPLTFAAPGYQWPTATKTVTDAAWTDLSGDIRVVGTSTTFAFTVLDSPCDSFYPQRYPRGTSFYLDEVTLTRTGDLPPALTTTPYSTPAGAPAGTASSLPTCPATISPGPAPQVLLRYRVTRIVPGGFTAALTITNLSSGTVAPWSVPVTLPAGRRITWVSGASLVTRNGQLFLTGPGVGFRATGRISLGFSGSPIGTWGSFGDVNGVPTGWN